MLNRRHCFVLVSKWNMVKHHPNMFYYWQAKFDHCSSDVMMLWLDLGNTRIWYCHIFMIVIISSVYDIVKVFKGPFLDLDQLFFLNLFLVNKLIQLISHKTWSIDANHIFYSSRHTVSTKWPIPTLYFGPKPSKATRTHPSILHSDGAKTHAYTKRQTFIYSWPNERTKFLHEKLSLCLENTIPARNIELFG